MEYWNNFPNMRNNSYQPLPRYEIIQVNGRAGAESFRMAPNSSALLLDTTGAIIWFARTDGAGYLTVTPYDFTPHAEQPPVDLNALAARVAKLEEYYVQQPNTGTTKSNKNSKQQSTAD